MQASRYGFGVFGVLIGACVLAGCGHKGPLYLPGSAYSVAAAKAQAPKAQQATGSEPTASASSASAEAASSAAGSRAPGP